MKKKLLSVVLIVVMVLAVTMGLAACGEKNTNDGASNTAGNEDASVEEGTDAEADSETDAEAETETEGETEIEVPGSDAVLEHDKTPINIVALKGPTAMGMVEMMQDSVDGNLDGHEYNFQLAAAPDEVAPLIIQGAVDIAAVPANLASVIYNKTEGGIQVLTINTLGVLYIVENGETVETVEDLAGKTIYASGQGATPEYALKYILSRNGIDPDNDVNIEWKAEHAECLSALLNDENGIAMLPQPFVTTALGKAEGLRVALDLTKEWGELQFDSVKPSELITGVTVARKAFVEEHPEAVEDFLNHYSASVDFTNSDLSQAAALCEAFDIIPAAVAEKAIPNCNIVFIERESMKAALSGYLEVLADQNVQAVGGAIPGDDFYYNAD